MKTLVKPQLGEKMKRVLVLLSVTLLSCTTVPEKGVQADQNALLAAAISRQTQTGNSILDWKAAGPMVIRIDSRDIVGRKAQTVSYGYQFLFEEDEENFRAVRVDMQGYTPKKEGDKFVELGSSIADGGFMTRWLAHDFVVSPAGRFQKYYSPFGVERILDFRKANLDNRLVSGFPIFFSRNNTELRLLQESITDAAILFKPREEAKLSYYLLNTKLKEPVLVECSLDSSSTSGVTVYAGNLEIRGENNDFGEDVRAQISAKYTFEQLENIPSKISISEEYQSMKTGTIVLRREVSVSIKKRTF